MWSPVGWQKAGLWGKAAHCHPLAFRGGTRGGVVTPCHLEATGGRVSEEEQCSQIQSAWLCVGTQSADGKYGPMCKITEQLGIIY